MSDKPAILQVLDNYYGESDPKHIRLGQYFCNNYIKSAWPELFYEESRPKATDLIHNWLDDNNYFYDLPEKLGE